MRFSDCGNFLHGVRIGDPQRGEPVFLNVGPHLSAVPLETGNSWCRGNSVSSSSASTAEQSSRPGELAKRLGSGSMQVSGIPEFTNFQGQLQVSALVQDTDKGSVRLQTMRADGKIIEKTITRLPKSSTLEQSHSTIIPGDSHENLRLVLNLAIQDTYSTEKPDFQLPAVLNRKKDSIPTAIFTPQQRLDTTRIPRKRFLPSTSDGSHERNTASKRQR
jgi:hypothetical protein